MKKIIYKATILLIISLTTLSSCKTFKCREMVNPNKVINSELTQNTAEQPVTNIEPNTLPKEDLLIDNKNNSFAASKNSYNMKSNSGIGGKNAVSSIYTIQKKNGTKAVIYGKIGNHARTADEQPKVEGLGLAGFIIGIVGWFMPLGLGLFFCLLAIIFGAISLARIKRNPEKYKGKGFAVTSLILGIVGTGLLLLLAALVL